VTSPAGPIAACPFKLPGPTLEGWRRIAAAGGERAVHRDRTRHDGGPVRPATLRHAAGLARTLGANLAALLGGGIRAKVRFEKGAWG
jgi:hypothetical protein